ncbi:MAG TPA: Uma2 family endonuclease [Geminicoccaceae bacterium]|nr:Uma2 family endonuclease [Geminicoccus sp.]HMU48737.1 Uma2 family endonuclease [Geminicoccaceae bacterium]
MADAAHELLTVEDWLAFDDGTDTRYELLDGVLVAMSPPSDRHGTISYNAARAIEDAAGDGPCRPVVGAGIEIPGRSRRRAYVADVAYTCEPPDDEGILEAPRLIVEVLSPSTKGIDKMRKVPDYSLLPSVEEIWLVESRGRWVVVWSRVDGVWVGTLPLTGSQSFRSRVLAADVHLDRLYRHTEL